MDINAKNVATQSILSDIFSSYTQAFNKRVRRRGSLFTKIFRRINVGNRNYFLHVIKYVHFNPVKHSFVKRMQNWDFSSYNIFI